MPRHATRTSFKFDPSKHIHFSCANCGKEFSRLLSDVKKRLARGAKTQYCSMKCLGQYRRGSKHHGFKSGKIAYTSLHGWIKRNLTKPKLCQHCQLKPPRDLANITGIYNRDLSNWRYLCKSCHAIYDGSISNIPRLRS
jgi:protein-arginine kinase activator protein McsA